MKEHVGACSVCNKELFCMDGFFNGIIQEDKNLICFECNENQESN